jgi:lipoprotein-anchoring transpeptidase ErfK/SrfK
MARFRSFTTTFAAALTVGVSCAGAAPVAAASPTQRLVVLDRTHRVFSAPDHRSHPRGAVQGRTPITRGRTVLPVLNSRTGSDRRVWLQVMLPGRPNGHMGWISPDSTRSAGTVWRLAADISSRRVTAFRYGHVVRRFRAVVGKPATPTPLGRFFVEETVQLGADRAGAPFALALSARSNVLQEFDGGPGQIALHGLLNVGGVPGTAASHGCLRLDTASISWLAERIGPGVPITIRR